MSRAISGASGQFPSCQNFKICEDISYEDENSNSPTRKKVGARHWHAPVILTTREAEEGGSLEARNLSPAWAM